MHKFLLVLVFPFFVSYVVYFGFGTNYTGGVFHKAGFLSQYEDGIYKYRIIGRDLLLITHGFISSENVVARELRRTLPAPPISAIVFDKNIDPTFYTAYFLQNTVFLMVCCGILYVIFAEISSRSVLTMSVMVAAFLMGLTQYVICPYDMLSDALLLLSYLLILRPSRFNQLTLALVLIVSTMTRESAALALSFFVAYNFERISGLRGRALCQLGLLTTIFLTTYLALRVFKGFDRSLWQGISVSANLNNSSSLIGILSLPLVSYLIAAGTPNKKMCLTFFVACAPYWLAMVVIALTWEIRLWVPIWLGLMILSRQAPSKGLE